jgi:flagellar protein FlaG
MVSRQIMESEPITRLAMPRLEANGTTTQNADVEASVKREAEELSETVEKDSNTARGERAQELLRRLEGGRLMPNARLSIDRDPGSGEVVYRSVNLDTGEIIRQFPSEEALKIMSAMRGAEGFLIDKSI